MSLPRATRGRSGDRSRSIHASPRSKPLHSRLYHYQLQLPTSCLVKESTVCDHHCPCTTCAPHTARPHRSEGDPFIKRTSKYAAINERRSICTTKRVRRAHWQRRGALPPTLLDTRRQRSRWRHAEALHSSAARRRIHTAPSVGTGGDRCAVSVYGPAALPCHPRPASEPSRAVSSDSRNSLPRQRAMLYWRCNLQLYRGRCRSPGPPILGWSSRASAPPLGAHHKNK